eukprot:664252-Pelagomonas_calceolata.AAC.6
MDSTSPALARAWTRSRQKGCGTFAWRRERKSAPKEKTTDWRLPTLHALCYNLIFSGAGSSCLHLRYDLFFGIVSFLSDYLILSGAGPAMPSPRLSSSRRTSGPSSISTLNAPTGNGSGGSMVTHSRSLRQRLQGLEQQAAAPLQQQQQKKKKQLVPTSKLLSSSRQGNEASLTEGAEEPGYADIEAFNVIHAQAMSVKRANRLFSWVKIKARGKANGDLEGCWPGSWMLGLSFFYSLPPRAQQMAACHLRTTQSDATSAMPATQALSLKGKKPYVGRGNSPYINQGKARHNVAFQQCFDSAMIQR